MENIKGRTRPPQGGKWLAELMFDIVAHFSTDLGNKIFGEVSFQSRFESKRPWT